MKSKKSGQILVMMALLSTTMIIFFGMVVGVGHMVQAKVNLQNAVDLAAMSGASWQARFLNHVSLVNYRMRQNYKFSLYDIYVTQSRFNKGLQRAVAGGVIDPLAKVSDGGSLTFGICQQAYGFNPRDGSQGVTTSSDYCQLVDQGGISLPPIVPSPVPNLNPIVIAANIAIAALEVAKNNQCRNASGQNARYFKDAMKQLEGRQKFQLEQMIEVLTAFDKAFGRGDVDLPGSAALADSTMWATFNANLISANRNGVKLEYLNPDKTRAFRDEVGANAIAESLFLDAKPTGSFSEYFERQRVRFKTFVADFGSNCSTSVKEENAESATFLGLSRARTGQGIEDSVKIPFSVVLKATVKPKILFWPTGLTPTLVAVGAAKPFGSRIGPTLEMSNFEVTGVPNQKDEFTTPNIANMSFYPGDVVGGSSGRPGIGHIAILRLLLGQLPRNNGQVEFRPSIENPTGGTTGGSGELQCQGGSSIPFLCLALAPTLYEGLFWNVYPYPIQKYSGGDRTILSEFPFDIPLKVADGERYFLPDRMFLRNPPQGLLDRWHETMLIQGGPSLRTPRGDPLFFANEASVASSWSPEIQEDVSIDSQDFKVSNKGRRGYQIKLVSLQAVCEDIAKGGAASGDMQKMNKFCTNETVKVYH